MTDNQNLNILVEAKKEYLGQLSSLMCPIMIETFQNLYEEARKMSKGKKVLLQYQKLLKEVVNWNNHMVRQHTCNISDSCSWFNDLLAAVFVSFVKILSSVRLNNCPAKKISIKLPTNDVFVHGCYIAAAKDIYKDPYIFHDESTEYERDEKLFARFGVCIENTVKEMVPVQEILKAYISQDNKPDIDVMSEAPDDTEDPDILDEPEQEEPEPEPEPELENDFPPGAEPDPEVVETRNIGIESKKSPFDQANNSEPPPEAVPQEPPAAPATAEDDVLFGDAPDQ